MKITATIIVLVGIASLAAANSYAGRLRQNPVKSYGQPMRESEPEEVVLVEEEPVVEYKAPTKIVSRTPIRVNSETYSINKGYNYDEEKLADDQARNAKYTFGSAIDDGIMDHSHVRQETRDGLKVEGSYAYSDGYFKRVVNYVADENGYRVVSESVEPISETGPKIDLENGKAEVHTRIEGVDNAYSVSAHEIPLFKNLNKKY